MRLVDADVIVQALDAALVDAIKEQASALDVLRKTTLVDFAKSILSVSPTVDAVPVVRCKDCRYYDDENHFCSYVIWAKPDGYCSGGKRRATDDN